MPKTIKQRRVPLVVTKIEFSLSGDVGSKLRKVFDLLLTEHGSVQQQSGNNAKSSQNEKEGERISVD